MKRIVTGLTLALISATLTGGLAMAQSETEDSTAGASTVSVVVTFDEPVLSASAMAQVSDERVLATIEDDYVLRIDLPADAVTGADISVDVTSAGGAGIEKVSANDAPFEELVAALESVDVSPADRWAREIMEYRPYDADDPSLGHLRDELAKYDPSAETLAGILSVLEP